jgi:O-methyltransferase
VLGLPHLFLVIYKLWREDREFLALYKRLSPGNPYSQDRKFVLRQFAQYTKGLQGSMAECGCYQGASAYFMAMENPDVPLHLFDSYEGLSQPSRLDVSSAADHRPWMQGDLAADEAQACSNLKQFPRVVFHKGWIPERFPDVAGEKFKLVHIDVDLYQPTKDSLAFFYPRMTPGGVIVMDDYGLTSCPGAHSAAQEFMRDKPEKILHLPTGQGVILKTEN